MVSMRTLSDSMQLFKNNEEDDVKSITQNVCGFSPESTLELVPLITIQGDNECSHIGTLGKGGGDVEKSRSSSFALTPFRFSFFPPPPLPA
jgi:hypothetical protein